MGVVRLCTIRGDSRPFRKKKIASEPIDTNIKRRVQIRRMCPFALFVNLISTKNASFELSRIAHSLDLRSLFWIIIPLGVGRVVRGAATPSGVAALPIQRVLHTGGSQIASRRSRASRSRSSRRRKSCLATMIDAGAYRTSCRRCRAVVNVRCDARRGDGRGGRRWGKKEDREIAGGSGEIVARAGGQIIPVIRGSPSRRLRFLSFSLARSPHPQGLRSSDDADERVYIMAQRFAPMKKEERSLFGASRRDRDGDGVSETAVSM